MFNTVPVNSAAVTIKFETMEKRVTIACVSPAQAIESAAQLAHLFRNASVVEDIQAVVVYDGKMVPIATYSRNPYTESNSPK